MAVFALLLVVLAGAFLGGMCGRNVWGIQCKVFAQLIYDPTPGQRDRKGHSFISEDGRMGPPEG